MNLNLLNVYGIISCFNIYQTLPESEKIKSLAYYFVCFNALRPKSTAMVIAGRSVHLTTLFPGQA